MKLQLQSLMPAPLAEQDTRGSQVWAQTLELESGKRYRVRAASGKGKTTLLAMCYGIRQDYTGTLKVDGADIRDWSASRWVQLRQHQMAMVFQGLRLFEQLSGWENLEIKNRLTRHRSRAELQEMCTRLEIASLLKRPCRTWSFGQRQRLALVRALCQPFQWLLLDEPFSHLDSANRIRAWDLLTEACEAQGAGLIETALGEPDERHFDQELDL